MKIHINKIIGFLCLAIALTGCKEEISSLFVEKGDIKAGDAVKFTTYVPGRATTRSTPEQDAFEARMGSYNAVAADYEFNIEMYEQSIDASLGNANYQPTKTIENEGEENETITYASDGTLVAANTTPLYWPGNAKKYAFKATAGTETLEIDQTTEGKLLHQDLLIGYGFEPLWNTDSNVPVDNEDGLNYRTAKEWYAANKQTRGLMEDNEEYKKIPLYLKHQRSLITVILKAGEGVNREDLAFERAQNNIATDIHSYGATTEENKTIQPLAAQASVDYTASDYGTVASDVETVKYSAVVEPHNYLAGATSDVIAEIRLSGQRFTFYASNDFLYSASQDSEANGHNDAVTHMNGYNLTAGKHLVITATLGRGSRKIVITAYVEDWTEAVTTSIVDDYGQAGDPIQINTRQQLRQFLESDRNKPGNVAIIVPNSLNLEQEENMANDWTPQPLNCTLNMAGATFRTDHQVFSTIGPSGNLVNGTISIGNTTVESAVADTNLGTIERVSVEPKDVNGNNSSGSATRAGLVVTNSGTITESSSNLPVLGNAAEGTVYVGGIAARSVYSNENGNTMPVIDGCRVNAHVGVVDENSTNNRGGGIVGEAVGRVTNNTFEYGITLSQNATNFKNIIQAKVNDGHDLRAYSNSWPTKATNHEFVNTNVNRTPAEEQYTAVIDCQSELALLLTIYNNESNKFRISKDFTVTKASGWNYGKKTTVYNSSGTGNAAFTLDGNNKTITTDAMLFTCILNEVRNLTIRVSADMIATPATNENDNDVMAPLAYAVIGENAKISNIQVKGGSHRIQAATVGGVVIWACGGATIENCQSKANLQVWVGGEIAEETKIYSGGIVACAANAKITRCIFHNTEGTLFRNISETYNGTTVPETTPSLNIFYGGILGGTAPNSFSGSAETPSVLITDCTSWFSTSDNAQKGAVVGYAAYADGNNLANGIADGCQGNWWNTTSDGIGTYKSGMTIEQLLGKRNAVRPTQDENY